MLFSLARPSLCEAQGAAHRRPAVLVLVHSGGRAGNAALSALIADSLKLELDSRQIIVLTAPDSASEAATGDSVGAALAEKYGADFAFWVTYTQEDSAIHLVARWIDPKKKESMGTASRSGPLDFFFDAMVASLVDEIVNGQKDQIARLPAAPATAPVQAPGVQALSPASENGPAAQPAVIGPKEESKINPVAFSIGSAPFISTFSAIAYFPLGLSVSLSGMYRIRVPGGLVGFGAATGVSGLHGRGASTTANFYLVPVGAGVQYGTRTGSLIDFFVYVQGGPALFILQPPLGNSLVKVVPYISSGLGILVSLTDNLGLSLDGSYTCFFDSPTPIMGFAPALSVVIRF